MPLERVPAAVLPAAPRRLLEEALVEPPPAAAEEVLPQALLERLREPITELLVAALERLFERELHLTRTEVEAIARAELEARKARLLAALTGTPT